MADRRRKHNVNPATLYKWKIRFVDGDKEIIKPNKISAIIQYQREIDNLKQIIRADSHY